MRPRSRGRRVWTVLLVALVAIGTFAGSMLGAAPPADLPGGRALDLIGVDGHVELLAPAGGPAEQREWAHLYGSEAFSGPYEFFMVMSVEGGPTMDEALATHWIRHTTTLEDGTQHHWLYSIDDAGLHMRMTVAEDMAITYLPGRLDVPADVAPGMEWQNSGTLHVLGTGQFPYTSEATASAADEFGAGCLRIRHVDQIEGAGELVQDFVWCPGRGVVSDGSYSHVEQPAPERTPVAQDWTPQNWTYNEPTAMQYEAGILNVMPLSEPLGIDGRAVVLSTTQDLVAFDDNWIYRGVSRPGGRPTAATQAEDLTLIASANRTITATDDRLWRRWQIDTDDVAVQVVPAGPDHFVSVTSSGQVTLHTLNDGAVVWQHTHPGAADFPVRVQNGRVFVVSGRQQVTALNRADGTTLATVELPDMVQTIGAGDDLLVVLGDTGRLFAYNTDGTPRWRAMIGGRRLIAEVVVTDTEVVYGGAEMMIAFDRDDGRTTWRRDQPAAQLLTDGEYVVAYDQTHLSVLRGDETVHHWPLSVDYSVSDFHCRGLSDGVVCIDGNGRISEARP
ncbi:MAG: PQQ-like beta-propeller repeat protein [Propionibacterium sp.]|nr:PQQ-like beta-propeller repeat protein [Propionibacterium sp.]